MSKHPIAVLLVAGVLLLSSAALQKRVAQKGPADFPATLAAAGKAWESGEFGACVKELRTALGLASEKRAQSIRESLPAAPAGWKAVPDATDEGPNPFAAAMAASVGSVVERKYRKEGERGEVSVTVTADSPLVQMFTMWVANPALLGPGAELIEYGAHKGVLKNEGGGFDLQILVSGVHICQVRAQGIDETGLFAMFDQAFVDRLAKVLGT